LNIICYVVRKNICTCAIKMKLFIAESTPGFLRNLTEEKVD